MTRVISPSFVRASAVGPVSCFAAVFAALCPALASAQGPEALDPANAVPEAGPVAIVAAPAPAKPPYSIPFQLRVLR